MHALTIITDRDTTDASDRNAVQRLMIGADVLLASRIRVMPSKDERTIQIVVTIHDDGIVGHPRIRREGSEAVITVRRQKVRHDVLWRAERERARLAGNKVHSTHNARK